MIEKQKARKSVSFKLSGYIFVVCMLLPALACTFVFTIYVDISAVAHAFQDDRTAAFTMDNFRQAMYSFTDTTTGDSLYVAFTNTLKYFFSGFITIPISLFLTYFLFKRIAGHNVFRTIFLLNSIIPGLIWITAYKEIISMNGILGKLMEALGRPMEHSLLKDPATATPAIIVYDLWLGLSGGMLYYFSAMSRIPDSVFEAALIDGCGPIREAVRIVLPLIGPTIGTLLTLKIAGFLGSSGPILLFTQGAAGTTTLAFTLYYRILQDPTGGIGVVSAIGLMMTAVSLPLSLAARFIINRYLPAYDY